jgi:hypothetical protein
MAALSQLSYGPLLISQCNREIEIVGPSDASPLVVSRRVKPEADLVPREPLDGQKEAAIELMAIRCEGIDLVCGVDAPHQSLSGAAIRIAADYDNVVVASRPFALHPAKFRAAVENQVVPLVSDGAKDPDAKLDCRQRDSRFRDRSLLIRCHIRQRTSRIGWAMS